MPLIDTETFSGTLSTINTTINKEFYSYWFPSGQKCKSMVLINIIYTHHNVTYGFLTPNTSLDFIIQCDRRYELLTVTLKLYEWMLSRSNKFLNIMYPVELLIVNVLESTEIINKFTSIYAHKKYYVVPDIEYMITSLMPSSPS